MVFSQPTYMNFQLARRIRGCVHSPGSQGGRGCKHFHTTITRSWRDILPRGLRGSSGNPGVMVQQALFRSSVCALIERVVVWAHTHTHRAWLAMSLRVFQALWPSSGRFSVLRLSGVWLRRRLTDWIAAIFRTTPAHTNPRLLLTRTHLTLAARDITFAATASPLPVARAHSENKSCFDETR